MYVINRADFRHSHEVSETLFTHYPGNRRLSTEAINFVEETELIQANKKLVANVLRTKFKKSVTAQDIINALKRNKSSDHNNVVDVLSKLKISK